MKQTGILILALAVILLSACQRPAEPTPSTPSVGTASVSPESSSNTPSSQNYTTTAGIPPTTEMKGSDVVPNPGSSALTMSRKSHEAGTPQPTSSVVPDKPAQAPQTDGPKEVTTSGTSVAGTTGKQQTTSTSRLTTSAVTAMTTAAAKSPWAYPYDVSEIIRDCKAEIARVGLVWSDSLVGLPGREGKPIGLPVGMSESDPSIDWASWDNPHNTGAYTKYPDMFSLKSYIIEEMIPFYLKNQDQLIIKRCKIWFEPDTQYPGDYDIYFLYSTS